MLAAGITLVTEGVRTGLLVLSPLDGSVGDLVTGELEIGRRLEGRELADEFLTEEREMGWPFLGKPNRGGAVAGLEPEVCR